jgi:hypothetical protein
MSNTPKANDMMPIDTPSKTTTTKFCAGRAACACSTVIAVMSDFLAAACRAK